MKTHRFFLAVVWLTAVAAQAQFEYITNDDTIVITGYTGSGGAVVIPGTITGLPVTEIQGSGFEDRGITSVAISATVTNIQAQEFSPNDELTSFTVDSNNPAYSAISGVLFNKSGTTLVEYPPGIGGSYAIPTNVTSIGDSAFAAAYNLSGVTMPNGLTNIGATGFGYCFSLTSVTIPASVTSIGPDTFINCYNLPAIEVAAGSSSFSSVGGVLFDKNGTTLLEYPTGLNGNYTIPNGVTTIGTNAFVLCDGVPNVAFPASVTSIDDGAFGDCSGLTNITLGAGVSYISTSAFGGSVNLLAINVNSSNANFSSLDGVVFNMNQTTLILFPTGFTGSYTTPGTVTTIAENAFEGCKLTDVTITGNVTSLELDAFQGCGNLTNATMAEGVGSIGIFAFADCPKLATVTVPASVSNIAYGAFDYAGLVSVYFEGNEPVADSLFQGDTATVYYQAGTSGWGPTFDGLNTVLQGAPNPNGALQVTILPDGAVAAGAQWQVDGGLPQPGAATVVGLAVGSHTVSFTTINGWTTPSNELVAVTADATNTASGTYVQTAASATNFTFVTNSGTIMITGYTGPGGTVEIPSMITGLPVTSIGASAFAGVSTFTSVTIPDSVTNVGQYAFSTCSGMMDVTISAGVSNMAVGTFEDCFNLIEVTFRGDVTNIDDYAFSSCDNLSGLTLPAGLTRIGQYAFFGNALTNVTIPASVTSIGVAAFMFCNQLPAISVDAANPAYTSAGGVLYNKNLTAVVEYPDGNPAASYAISNTVTSIGDSAFEYCAVSSITIPESVTSIGNYSFENCSALAGVILPTNLLSIGDSAFAACDALTGITLPASVTNLGQVPFVNCANMAAITVAAGNPAFSGVNGVLYNKAGTLLVEYPGGEAGSFTIPNGVEDIGLEAFEQTLLTSVIIPASVTNIEFSGFFNCLSLTSVFMADGITTIGPAAFESCYVLTHVGLPASVRSIGSSAFGSCSALATIVIPSGVKSVGDYAFAYDTLMASAYFAGNAPPDDGTAFVNDSAAKVYYLPGATGWGSTFGSAPTMELPGITSTARPTNGYAPLPVSFTAASETSATNPVVNWNWDFGDGATSSTQNPAHTYAAFGHFAASVVETNSLGVPIAGEVMTIVVTPVPIYLGLVENGGFETGDFTGWDLFGGDPPDNFVTNIENGIYPYAGNYYAVLGATNVTYLSQTLTTQAGQPYLLSLWLNSPDGLGPNAFQVSWNGSMLFNQSNLPPSFGWTNLQFKVSATGTNTALEMGFLDSPSFLGLDEISVYPVQADITSVTLSGADLVLDGTGGQSGHEYVVLTSTNLALPLNQWTPFATNALSANGSFSMTITNAVSAALPHRFYILQTP